MQDPDAIPPVLNELLKEQNKIAELEKKLQARDLSFAWRRESTLLQLGL